MIRQVAVAAALVVALASGCGSSSGGGASGPTTGSSSPAAATGSTPSSAATTSSTPTTEATTPTTGADDATKLADFEAFMIGVHKTAAPVLGAWAHMNTALQSFDPNDSASWDATLTPVRAAATASDRGANQLRSLHAPDSLKPPFAKYVVMFHKQATVLNQMAAALEAHDLSAIATWNGTAIPELNADITAGKRFTYTVLAFMARNGLPLPSWSKQYGFSD